MNLTAYPADEAELKAQMARGSVDAESFRRPLARCDLSVCQGMCCYDGVYVSPESAAVIERIAREKSGFFAELGLALPDKVIVEGNWPWKQGGLKTAVQLREFSKTVQAFPSHFNDTACIFLTEDGRCSLQMLSVRLGQHPWYYKPIKCWMHPITMGGEPPILRLHNTDTDPYRVPGYDGFVTQIFCGKTYVGAAPASVTLADELHFLSQIVQRDLWGEVTRSANR